MKGNIFDIQRYSIHDGKGIRTVVFLKGCPLRCKWCANPESWEVHPQLYYVKSKCIGCKTCVATCANHEVEAEEDHIKVIRENCTGDYTWVDNCPTGALRVEGQKMQAKDVVEEVKKDQIFYQYSDGGVTFSGGEPLLQKDFIQELLELCKQEGISTAVETAGLVSPEVLDQVRPYVDLFLYDIKSMDPEVHWRWTGQSNDQILQNLKRLAQSGANIMVRTPLIPGVNDREEDINAIMDYLNQCGIRKYSILPFHQYGSGKYESLGLNYELADLKVPSDDYIVKLKKQIQDRGFTDEF